MSVVYQIKNTENGKIYIGSTHDREKRWQVHKRELSKDKHHNKHLQRAWHKYGTDAFEFSVVEEVNDKDKLLEREQHYLDNLDPEYNIAESAEAPHLNKHHTEKTKQRISETLSGQNAPMYGRERSKKVKEAVSKANSEKQKGSKNNLAKLTEKKVKVVKHLFRGGHFSCEDIGEMYGVAKGTIVNINLGRTWSHIEIEEKGHIKNQYRWDKRGENNPFYGQSHSKETKKSISKAKKGTKLSPRTKAKVGKLTKKKVKVIKHLLASEKFSYSQIGKMYGVVGATIGSINREETWNHVTISN